jgi:hypothetical protein
MLATMVHLVIYLVVVGLVAWLLMFLLDYIPVPQPFNKIGKVIIMVLSVLIVIFLLLDLVGGGAPKLGLR